MTSTVVDPGQQQLPAYARLLELVQQAQRAGQQAPWQQQHLSTTLQDVLIHLLAQLLPPLALPGGSLAAPYLEAAAEGTGADSSAKQAGDLQQHAAGGHNDLPDFQQPQQWDHNHNPPPRQQQQQQQQGGCAGPCSPSRKRGHAVACRTDTSSHQRQQQPSVSSAQAQQQQEHSQQRDQQQQLLSPPLGTSDTAAPGYLQPDKFQDQYKQQLAAALHAGALCVTSSCTCGTAAGDTAQGAALSPPQPGLIYSSAWGAAPVQLQPHAAGGHSGVYRGTVAAAGQGEPQAVVAKVLHLTTSLSHAQTELSALAAATHSGATHVVSLLGVGLDLWSLSPALLLEAGEQTLSERVRAEGALSEAAARKVVREVLLGLQQLQEAGWAHGDVKPGNVVEAQGVAKLADIGSAVPLTTAAAASAAAAGVEGTVTVQSVQHQPHEGEEHAGTAVALAGANAPELPALTPNSGGRQQRSFRGSRVYAAPELLVEVAATTAAAAAAAADIGPQGLSSGSRLQATALEEGAAATAAASSSTAGRRPRRRGPASVTTAAGAAAAAHVAGADVPGATKAAAAAAATAAQAADVWSVGCLLLFLATGRHPRDLPVDQLAAAASAGEGGAVQVVLQKYIAAVTGAGGEPPTAQQQQQQSQQQQQQQQAQETEAPPQEAGSPSKRRRLQLHMQLALPDGHPPNSEGGEFVLHLEPGVVEARAASTQPNSHRQQQLQEEEAFRIGVPAPPDALPSAPHGAAADGGSGGLLPTAPCWLSSSPGALQVAAACLQPDPGRRPSVEQLLRLPWLTAE